MPKQPVGKKSKKGGASAASTSESPSMIDDSTAEFEPTASSSAAASGSSSSSSAAAGSGAGLRIHLDADCLSVVLSFLSTADFLSALRVNSQWRAARTRRLAWPALSVAALIRALQDGDFSNPIHRMLAINSPHQLRSLFACAESLLSWKHATAVRVVQHAAGGTQPEACDDGRLIDRLLAFTAMQALTLDGAAASAEEIERLFAAIKDRLLALTLLRCTEVHLGSLSQLRILVLDRIPPSTQLAMLPHLAYLHMESHISPDPNMNSALATTIRDLSVRCALRSLSLAGFNAECSAAANTKEFFKTLQRDTSRPEPLPGAASYWSRYDLIASHGLTDLSLRSAPGKPTNDAIAKSFADLFKASPQLRRLQYEDESRDLGYLAQGMRDTLHELSLTLHSSHSNNADQMRHLESCAQLRVLHLSVRDDRGIDQRHRSLPVFVSKNLQKLLRLLPQIEEIRLGVDLKLLPPNESRTYTVAWRSAPTPTPAYNPKWPTLASRHLRVLELPLQPEILADQLPALRSLRSFRTLELSFRGTVPAALPPALLSSMAASDSWFNLHLHALPPQPTHVDFIPRDEAGGLKQQLAALPAHIDPRVLRRIVTASARRLSAGASTWTRLPECDRGQTIKRDG